MSDGNNGGTGLTPMRALIEDLMKSTSCQTCQRALNMIHILIDSRDCETARSKAALAASEEARRAERAAVVRECAHTAYVVCAETRHGILGDRCHAAICRIATDADNAALDKLLREARKVKPLEWHDNVNEHRLSQAVSHDQLNPIYYIIWSDLTLTGPYKMREFANIEEAKAAAQADYEARILAALEAPQ